MHPTQFSSGDVIADRRADYARMLADNGEHEAAVELMEQALELAPTGRRVSCVSPIMRRRWARRTRPWRRCARCWSGMPRTFLARG